MQSAVVKYWAPCDDKGWQRLLRDIGTAEFPLCRGWRETVAREGESEQQEERERAEDAGANPWQVGPSYRLTYSMDNKLNPLKMLVVDPVEAYCSVSYKHGHVVVRTPPLGDPVRRRAVLAYMRDAVAADRGRRCHETTGRGSLFRLAKGAKRRKVEIKEQLMHLRSELETLYRDTIPIAVGTEEAGGG